ncbi:hypothetical protein COBT_003396 [Conglomerata obtusa]
MVESTNTLKEFFNTIEVVSTRTYETNITIIGKSNGQNAIVAINSPSVTEKNIFDIVKNNTYEKCTLQNDVFSCYDMKSDGLFNIRVIYPADDEKLKKYQIRKVHYVKETKEEYDKFLEEQIKTGQVKNNWIRNIIEYCNQDGIEIEKTLIKTDYEQIKDVKKNYTNKIEEKNKNEEKNIIEEKNINEEKNILNKEKNIINNKNLENDKNQEEQINNTKNDNNQVIYNENQENDQKQENGNEITKNLNESNKIISDINQEDNIETEPIIKKIKKNFHESIYYNDDEFVIIPNYKWDLKDLNKLYLILLFKQENLYTIRELNDPDMLIRAKNAVYKTVKSLCNFEEDEIYMFFHYHPTYYSLHLHICNVNFFGSFSNAGKAILIDDVIENLKTNNNFYCYRDMFHVARKD